RWLRPPGLPGVNEWESAAAGVFAASPADRERSRLSCEHARSCCCLPDLARAGYQPGLSLDGIRCHGWKGLRRAPYPFLRSYRESRAVPANFRLEQLRTPVLLPDCIPRATPDRAVRSVRIWAAVGAGLSLRLDERLYHDGALGI